MVKSIKEVLIKRDGMSDTEVSLLIEEAREDLRSRIDNGEMPFDICAKWFGLEEDYLDQLIGDNTI